MRATTGRRGIVAASTSVAVLAASTLMSLAGGGAGVSATAAPAADCTAAFPVTDLADGDAVTGLTVSRGTEPGSFSGEIIGVLDGGIAPHVDMVLARLTSPEIERVGGIWSGMSGSPVYAADGRLIGAVSYGLAWGASPVAGITPFEDMDAYLGGAAAPAAVTVGPKVARAIAAASEDVTARQAAQGLRQLPMPVGISGISARRVAKARSESRSRPKQRRYLAGSARAVGGGGLTADATANDVVAGGNLAAAISYGDITLAGTGTATSVCHGRVVGFGHPFDYSGPTTLSLHPASALYVQDETLGAPFKVANLGAPVGTITDDRLTGITGTFGRPPASAEITSNATYRGASRQGSSRVNLDTYSPDVTFYQTVANQEAVTDGWVGGSAEQSWTIVGTDATGKQFSLSYSDRFTSADITFTSVWDLADLVWAISRQPGVDVASVRVDAAMDDERDTLRVTKVQQKRQGQWRKIDRRRPAVVKAGRSLNLRTTMLTPRGRAQTTRTSVDVPRRASGQRAYLQVSGGQGFWSNAAWLNNLPAIIKAVKAQPRNDEVVTQLRLLQPGKDVRIKDTSPAQDYVVRGKQQALVLVR